MFVSVILDPGAAESAKALAQILTFYGYTKKQRSCWEHTAVSEARLLALKKDIDRVTDYYDTLRIYQYPVQGVMAITELNKKKWRKMLMRMS
ncbi:MAG: CRISPR-associated protein Cas2 [Treponema sp.]|jgi:CRISPR-associated protein Cas2|nr:CRISPR-associated protein Cas2 [Treponema sp.]